MTPPSAPCPEHPFGGRELPRIGREGDPPPGRGAVAAIGNFDGVHRGHQHLLAVTRAEAARRGGSSAVLTFEPHPRDVFRPDTPVFRLTPEPVKLKILGRLGIEVVFSRRFDRALAGTSAAGFVDGLLRRDLALSAVVIGADFHFGRGREGTPTLLGELGRAAGIDVLVQEAVNGDGAAVSSSRVRAALAAGDVTAASELLGYRWFVQGVVQHGEKLGRTLGFPTANLALPPSCGLRHGIYAVRVATEPDSVLAGVASFGRRPTFDDGAPLLEVHLFDFAGDLYGREIEVEFLRWIRGEERFASAAELVVAMERDAAEARTVAAGPNRLPSLIG